MLNKVRWVKNFKSKMNFNINSSYNRVQAVFYNGYNVTLKDNDHG